MEGYYPKRQGGMTPESYFTSLIMKNNPAKRPEETTLLRKKYKEAYY